MVRSVEGKGRLFLNRVCKLWISELNENKSPFFTTNISNEHTYCDGSVKICNCLNNDVSFTNTINRKLWVISVISHYDMSLNVSLLNRWWHSFLSIQIIVLLYLSFDICSVTRSCFQCNCYSLGSRRPGCLASPFCSVFLSLFHWGITEINFSYQGNPTYENENKTQRLI
jgi:hypothetical protein